MSDGRYLLVFDTVKLRHFHKSTSRDALKQLKFENFGNELRAKRITVIDTVRNIAVAVVTAKQDGEKIKYKYDKRLLAEVNGNIERYLYRLNKTAVPF